MHNTKEQQAPYLVAGFSSGPAPADERGWPETRHRYGDLVLAYSNSPDIRVYADDAVLVAVVGHINHPARYRSQHPLSRDDAQELAGLDPVSMAGSFVLVRGRLSGGRARSLEVISDKHGTRRLFYQHDPATNAVIFSTHVRGLCGGERSVPGINPEGLVHYYCFGFAPSRATLLEGIDKLPAATILTLSGKGASVARYFDPGELFVNEDASWFDENAVVARIEAALGDSVRDALPADGAVGIALSGGVDSGYIAQKLVQASSAPVFAYNLSYSGHYDEHRRVDYLSRELGLNTTKISVSPDEIIDNYLQSSKFCSEPVGFNNATMRIIYRCAADDGVQTLYDGDAADRLFLGMNRQLLYFRAYRVYTWFRALGLAKPLAYAMAYLPGKETKKLGIHVRNWAGGMPPYPERDMSLVEFYSPEFEKNLYQLGCQDIHEDYERFGGRWELGRYLTYHSIRLCPEMFFYEPSDLSFPHGIRIAHAFISDSFLGVGLNTPTSLKLKKGKTKYILRKSAEQALKSDYWMLPKIGLQSSFSYVAGQPAGRRWLEGVHEEIRSLPEYHKLAEIVPSKSISLNKLVPLYFWKKALDAEAG